MTLYIVYFVSNEYELKIALKAFKNESDAINWVETRNESAKYLDGHLKIDELKIDEYTL